MGKVKVAGFAVSLDGFGAGQGQDLQNPLGKGGLDLHEWIFKTRTFQKMFGGGVSVVRQYLKADLIDEMHLVFSPIFLGQGESLLTGIDLPAMGFKETGRVTTELATHVVLKK